MLALLEAVSRSFYLTVKVLPGRVREPVALAYLLARATDTVADTEAVAVEGRLDCLRLLRERIASTQTTPLPAGSFAEAQSADGERLLLNRLEALIELLEHEPPELRDPIRVVLATITSGQELDLVRFRDADAQHLVALETDAELDDYTYRVAGCVGEFWTDICRSQLFPKVWVDLKSLLARSVRFGKGLQLVNILRDVPADLRQGRCYLPAKALAGHGLTPADLLDAANGPRFRPLFTHYLQLAEAHLESGWTYTTLLPYRLLRLRLACAWPLLIGIRTLARLRVGNVLDATQRIKVNRGEVRSIMARTIGLYPFPGIWNRLFERARRQAVR